MEIITAAAREDDFDAILVAELETLRDGERRESETTFLSNSGTVRVIANRAGSGKENGQWQTRHL